MNEAEKTLENLIKKYQTDGFPWKLVLKSQLENDVFLTELHSELSETHSLFNRKICRSVAKSCANDDVLFLSEDGKWLIVHLTYTKTNFANSPRFIEFLTLEDAVKHIEDEHLSSY